MVYKKYISYVILRYLFSFHRYYYFIYVHAELHLKPILEKGCGLRESIIQRCVQVDGRSPTLFCKSAIQGQMLRCFFSSLATQDTIMHGPLITPQIPRILCIVLVFWSTYNNDSMPPLLMNACENRLSTLLMIEASRSLLRALV